MKRSTAARNKDRADLLAALAEATKPVRANELAALAHGYTLATIPDRVLEIAWRRAMGDLRGLARTGQIVLDTHGFVATYTRVDLPGSDLAEQQAANDAVREDWADLHRQVDGWDLAD